MVHEMPLTPQRRLERGLPGRVVRIADLDLPDEGAGKTKRLLQGSRTAAMLILAKVRFGPVTSASAVLQMRSNL